MLRCHIFDLETYKNANLVCTWYMPHVYQSYTKVLAYIHLFLVYSWYIAVISNIPGVYSHLPIVVCSCYLVWTILLVGGGHPSWPLEVTGNSGFFKLVYWRNFVAAISSNPYTLCAGGNTVLSISRLGWA